MRHSLVFSITVLVCIPSFASADTFGTGANQFEIEFVTISGDASSANGTYIGDNKPEGFNDPDSYRMGTYEITNDQWNKFQTTYGTVTGGPLDAYNENPFWTGNDVPTNNLSWYEGAQFVNWLNTSTGHQAAYKFTGTQGTRDYTLSVWDVTETDGANLYRHKDAHYFMPTEDEWVKAAYWNGTSLQTYASVGDVPPTLSGWNYDGGPEQPWNVGSGSEELNGTFDMMGNVLEWMESPYSSGDYSSGSDRGVRGGSAYNYDGYLRSSYRHDGPPYFEYTNIGFRVASIIPEPTTLVLFGLGGLVLRKRAK